ncbi:MAG: polyprenyl synthetase family protein [Turicibacter sp.]
MSLTPFIQQTKAPFETYMMQVIDSELIPSLLKESMRYSLSVGGKRLRPLLIFAVLDSANISVEVGYSVACALEMIHTYSLIHDDLPAMDDDALRRGKPTNHVVFGEATAILAGDSLLTFAFEVIAKDQKLPVEKRLELMLQLSKAAGPTGMVAGQVLDMGAEEVPVSLEALKNIHVNKTGKLIEYGIVAGAILADFDPLMIAKLSQYAYHLGLAFQIKDDILDIEGSTEVLGKVVGSDVTNGKSTYVSLTSLDEAKQMLDDEIQAALDLLSELDIDFHILKLMTHYIKERQL